MSKTILLVEDDPSISACVKLLLSKLSYNLAHAWNGLDALQYLHDNPNCVSLILLDVNMPRMNGLEFLSIIKADLTLSKIPVILQTAATDEEMQKGRDLGAELILLKPYTGGQLCAAIEKSMEIAKG